MTRKPRTVAVFTRICERLRGANSAVVLLYCEIWPQMAMRALGFSRPKTASVMVPPTLSK